MTASAFDETRSTTKALWNVQKDDDTYLIKFVEPCPKVEWAGELNRDRHFVVNTESDDPNNLEVSVFNPNHGQSKFHDMTSDRLQNIFLYYREVGDLHWSKGRTEITNDDGSVDSLDIDFAAEYASEEESDYGYSSLKWALANKVPEGTYEIRIDTECDQLGGPADMDSYSTPILSGIIDLTRPEQYGRALPLRDSFLIGEEISVVFTEPVRCEAFDLSVVTPVDDLAWAACGQSWSCSLAPRRSYKSELHSVRCCSDEEKNLDDGWVKRDHCDVWAKSKHLGTFHCYMAETYDDAEALCQANGARLCTKNELETDCASFGGCKRDDALVWSSTPVESLELDRNDPPIQIVCDGRKVGFTIDPSQINVEDWIGMRFVVEMGKVNTANVESKSNIFDMNGNAIESNVIFEKTFADFDLDKASTSFNVSLNNTIYCSDVESHLCEGEIKDTIASLLGMSLSDSDRIVVESVSSATDSSDSTSNSSTSTVIARIKVLPIVDNTGGRMLRRGDAMSGDPSNTGDHSVGLFRKLQGAVVVEGGEQRSSKNGRMMLDHAAADTDADFAGDIDGGSSKSKSKLDVIVVGISDLKILPGESDMKKLFQTDAASIEEEEELYRYATASVEGSSNVRIIQQQQPIMSKVERETLVDEIENRSKSRAEEMMNEIKSSKNREESIISREEDMMIRMERMSRVEDALYRELNENKEKSRAELKMLRFELMAVTLACIGISLFAYISLRRE